MGTTANSGIYRLPLRDRPEHIQQFLFTGDQAAMAAVNAKADDVLPELADSFWDDMRGGTTRLSGQVYGTK